jgi:hypothetical protein
VFPIIVVNTQNFMQQPDPNYRRAALTILAVAAEGYSRRRMEGRRGRLSRRWSSQAQQCTR